MSIKRFYNSFFSASKPWPHERLPEATVLRPAAQALDTGRWTQARSRAWRETLRM